MAPSDRSSPPPRRRPRSSSPMDDKVEKTKSSFRSGRGRDDRRRSPISGADEVARRSRREPRRQRSPADDRRDGSRDRSRDKRDRSRDRRDRRERRDRSLSKEDHRTDQGPRRHDEDERRSHTRHDDREERRRRHGRHDEADGRKSTRRRYSASRSRSPPPRRYRDRRSRSKDGKDSRRPPADSRSPPPKRRRQSPAPSKSPPRKARGPLASQEASFRGGGDSSAVVLDKDGKPIEKQKPNFNSTGLLAKEANTVAGTNTVLKYHEPPEARKPPNKQQWRIYVFKGKETIDTIHLYSRSCWLMGRDEKICDYAIQHPSASKQHAVIQFRFIEKRNEFGEREGKVKPYLIDLESANGTKLNGKRIEGGRYLELLDGDVVSFGESGREYVVMLPPA